MNTEIWDIIARSFAGEASKEDLTQIDTWIASEPENAALLEEAQQVWKASGEVPIAFQPDVNAAWNKMSATIDAEETPVIAINRKGLHKHSRLFISIAAAVILLLGSMVYLKVTSTESGDGFAQQIVAMNEVQEVTLPDGTKVTLNANSRLFYPTAFNADERIIKLHGEAFFDVTKNPDKPFVILSTKTRTEVLGTSFNLRTFPGKKKHELVVHTGKVSFLGFGADEVILEPGEKGTFYITGDVEKDFEMIKSKAPSTNDVSWITGKLEFNGTPLRQLFSDLEKHYNVQFKTDSSVPSSADFTGDYNNATLEQVTQDIATATGLNIRIEGDKVTVSGAGS